jgi:hypothetical protein
MKEEEEEESGKEKKKKLVVGCERWKELFLRNELLLGARLSLDFS